MIKDTIVEEVRKAREEYAKCFNYDLDGICKDLKRQQGQNNRKVVSFSKKIVNDL